MQSAGGEPERTLNSGTVRLRPNGHTTNYYRFRIQISGQLRQVRGAPEDQPLDGLAQVIINEVDYPRQDSNDPGENNVECFFAQAKALADKQQAAPMTPKEILRENGDGM